MGAACDDQVNEQPSYILYKRRWFILLALSAIQMCCGFAVASVGQVSNIFVAFYRVGYKEVDWLTLGANIGPVVLTVPLSFIIAKNCFGFRYLSLAAAGSSTAGFACLSCSVIHRSLFPVTFLGQILNSAAKTTIVLSPPVFAALWFPEQQVGTAIGINIMSMYLGNAIGFFLPATVLTQPNTQGNTSLANQTQPQWVADDQLKLGAIFSSFLLISGLCFVYLYVYVTDRPPTPPNKAQKVKESRRKEYESPSPASYWSLVASLLVNRTYLLACVVFGILFQVIIVEYTMLAQIMKEDFGKENQPFRADTIAGYIMFASAMASMLGCFAGGELVDRCKQYKAIAISSCFLAFMSSVGLVVALMFRSLPFFFVCSAFFGVMAQFGVVSIYDIIAQHTYPIDESFSCVWLIGTQALIAILLGELGRILYRVYGGLAVLLLQSVSLLISVILSCFFVSQNKRLEAQDAFDLDLPKVHERTALITNES